MMEEAYQQPRNDEAIIRIIGKITLAFSEFEDLEKQRKLKSVLDESLYGYEIHSKCTDLIVSDIEEKMGIYLACRKLEGISPKTIKNYQGIITKFADFFHKPLSSITAMDIRMWLAAYRNAGNTESTINSKIFCLSKFFGWLVNEEYLMKNPMLKVNIVKQPKRIKKVMSEEQLELLRQGCKTTRDKLLIEFGFSTGCRVSEVADAKISSINWNEKSVYIIGKGNKERKVYFNTKTKMLLERYLQERKEFEDKDSLILAEKFPYKGVKSRALQLIFNKIKERVGLGEIDYITMHGLRRACFTHELKHGMKLEQIQRLAGHESPETTLRYAQMTDGDLKHAYEIAM
ncbi:tyrosine-type recombinase/integrase [Clostridium beijerinckii]|uniref:Tyrosine recombinase XerC n=1 Tax=Clostridium beijerinckii TaxID=1520 RepID=A0A1S8S9V9_CLOBE|nr:tyrosine-type recombinase/integrase [Clostridium beijerinckii]NRY59869.1 integrase/recombinase XerD [Clostridium beijerinckii]OOM62223.1 tyrosine recombinase XerC [Clostridium beijerinckii]